MKKTPLLIAFIALLPVIAEATVTLNLGAGLLLKSDGITPLPTNSTIVLLADADLDGFGSIASATGAFKADDGDEIVGRLGTDDLGGPGTLQQSLSLNNPALFGAPLMLVWYDLPYNVMDTGPGNGTLFGTYRNDNPMDGSAAWFVPDDGSTMALSFLTASLGGSHPDSAGATLNSTSGAVPGDVTSDGVVDDDDIDTLFANLGSGNPIYDLDGSGGAANSMDVDFLVRNILGTQYGDANLDRRVNITDLSIVATFFGVADSLWSQGNFNGTGGTNITDLSTIALYFGTDLSGGGGGEAGHAIPEPATILAMLTGLGVLVRRRKA